MKKNFLLAIMVLISVTAYAQSEKFAVGLNIGYGSASDLNKASIGVKANYDINAMFAIAPSFNYYFHEKENFDGMEAKFGAWDLNCDLHFNVLRKESFKLYPLAGITYLHAKSTFSYEGMEESNSEGRVGANLGVGAQFVIASHFVIAPEVKYQIISDLNQFVPSVALMYKF